MHLLILGCVQLLRAVGVFVRLLMSRFMASICILGCRLSQEQSAVLFALCVIRDFLE